MMRFSNFHEKLEKMRNLAWKLTDERRRGKDVVAILLFGSVAKGNIHPRSDIDLVVIRDSHENSIKRSQMVEEKIKIDLWEHSYSFYKQLFEKNWVPKQMFLYSLFLNILQECEILHDRDSIFQRYKENALEWKWPANCKEFMRNKIANAINDYENGHYNKFEKLVYMRKIFLLRICMKLLSIGKPVSIRNKDYYLKCKKYFSAQEFETIFGKIPNRRKLGFLIKKTTQIFHNAVKDRDLWTELRDAESHFSNKEDFMAAISLQNGAYYVGCAGLENKGIIKKNKGFLYPKSVIELIRKANKHWKEFYCLYREIHNVEAWGNKEINSTFGNLLDFLKDT